MAAVKGAVIYLQPSSSHQNISPVAMFPFFLFLNFYVPPHKMKTLSVVSISEVDVVVIGFVADMISVKMYMSVMLRCCYSYRVS